MYHQKLPFDVVTGDIHIIQVQVYTGSRCQKYKFVQVIKLSTSNGFGEHFVVALMLIETIVK